MLARLGQGDAAHVLSHRPSSDTVERVWQLRLLRDCARRALAAMADDLRRIRGASVQRAFQTIPLATVQVPVDPRLGVDGTLRRLGDLPSVVMAAVRRRDLTRVATPAAVRRSAAPGATPAPLDGPAAMPVPHPHGAPGFPVDDTPLVGVIERGRPDLAHPALAAIAASARVTAGIAPFHPHATAVAAALLEGTLAPPPRTMFVPVSRDCRQQGWLAGADSLAAHDARVLNLSLGVRPSDLGDGWELFERGLVTIAALHGISLVAAAGSADAGAGVLVPARDPAVLAVGGAEHAAPIGAERPELLASDRAPFGDAPGSSFAAPRIAALAAHAMAAIPRAQIDPALVRALLMAARPGGGRIPRPARLRRLVTRGCFAWGDRDALIPVRAAGAVTLSAVLAWSPWPLDDLLLSPNLSLAAAPGLELVTTEDGRERTLAAGSQRSWAEVRGAIAGRPALRVRSGGTRWALAWDLEDSAER